MHNLMKDDPDLARLVSLERDRVENSLNLIAAESHVPLSIMEVQGTILQAKTIEGYPGKRFHAGCSHVDAVEQLAMERGCELFGAEHANVQPNSGTAANLAVYFSVLEVGDPILAMRLAHGGHLSHGHRASITSRCFHFDHYQLDPESERIDYEAVAESARRLQPKMLVAGASAYPRLIDYERMASIARDAGALFMVDMAHIAGLVAAGVIPSPVPHADFVTFTGYKTMMGGRGGVVLCRQEFADRLDRSVFPGTQGTSGVHLIAAKALSFHLAKSPAFIAAQERTLSNAASLAESLQAFGYRIMTGGTDNHQVLIDVRAAGISGTEAENWLESAGIVANRNVMPADAEHPGRVSGIRLGTSALSSRGMGEKEMELIGTCIHRVLTSGGERGILSDVKGETTRLCHDFPLYPEDEA